MVPMVERHPEVEELIEQKQYFIIHSPRQTGKTTLVQELVNKIRKEDHYYPLYCSLESVEVFTEPERGITEIFHNLKFSISYSSIPQKDLYGKDLDKSEYSTLIKKSLSDFCSKLDKPLILFIDEIDCLSDKTLLSFIRQLRNGYITRNEIPFPHSIALIGMRNIRDFKFQIREKRETLGTASPFNIIKRDLTIDQFTIKEIHNLYSQHTEDTGQIFTDSLVQKIFENTGGQPWLVNAIANEIVEDILKNDVSKTIEADMVDIAIQNIILRRDTHIDSLLDKLQEQRVINVIQPLIIGGKGNIEILHEDTQYCLNLGLIRMDKELGLVPANNIYKEIIIRTLNYQTQYDLSLEVKNEWIKEDGHIDMNGLLKEFQVFWRLNSGIWEDKYLYKEAAPHLVLNAFLQRVINGGGHIAREYAYARGRMDLCVQYKNKNYPIEIKLLYNKNTIQEGFEQLSNYLDGLGEKRGWLVIFDRDPNKTWEEKISQNTVKYKGYEINLLTC